MDTAGIIGWVLTALLLGLVIFQYYSRSAPSSTGNIFDGPLGLMVKSFFNIIPFGLFSFGIVSDMIFQEVKMSIPSYAVITVMIILRALTGFAQTAGWIPSSFSTPGPSDTNQLWCSLPGLEFLENAFVPSSVFSSMTVLFYYLWWAVNTGQHVQSIGITTLIVMSTTTVQFVLGKCTPLFMNFLPGAGALGVLFPTWLLSMFVSGMVFSLVLGIDRSKNPLSNIPAPASSGSSPCPNGADNNGQCLGPNSGAGLLGQCPDGYLPLDTNSCIQCASAFASVIGGKCVSNDPRYTVPDPPVIVNRSGAHKPIPGKDADKKPSSLASEQTFVAELYKDGELVKTISK
jgi:hypothetical protein